MQRIVSRNCGIDEREARELAHKRNKLRTAYYNFYTDKVWGDGASYDICINSSIVGTQGAAELIALFARKKMEMNTPK